MTRFKDRVGERFGRLTVLARVGSNARGTSIWMCKCDCGNFKNILTGSLQSGNTRSCGCLANEESAERCKRKFKTHGMSNTPEYGSWDAIKKRCYDENNKDFKKYGAKGILMGEEFRGDFGAFIEEMGRIPDTLTKWTVDRVDNSKGYIKGNMRWATSEQQSRNRSMSSRNTSGITGVNWRLSRGLTFAVTYWSEETSGTIKLRSRSFSVRKFGLLPAFANACKYREDQITRLNSLGYDYSENHGKELAHELPEILDLLV